MKTVLQAIDGMPLIGPVSIADVKLNYMQDSIDLSWKVLENTGNVKSGLVLSIILIPTAKLII